METHPQLEIWWTRLRSCIPPGGGVIKKSHRDHAHVVKEMLQRLFDPITLKRPSFVA